MSLALGDMAAMRAAVKSKHDGIGQASKQSHCGQGRGSHRVRRQVGDTLAWGGVRVPYDSMGPAASAGWRVLWQGCLLAGRLAGRQATRRAGRLARTLSTPFTHSAHQRVSKVGK